MDYVENDPELKFREVIHPRDKRLVSPAFLDGTLLPGDRREDPRMELALWMTSHPFSPRPRRTESGAISLGVGWSTRSTIFAWATRRLIPNSWRRWPAAFESRTTT